MTRPETCVIEIKTLLERAYQATELITFKKAKRNPLFYIIEIRYSMNYYIYPTRRRTENRRRKKQHAKVLSGKRARARKRTLGPEYRCTVTTEHTLQCNEREKKYW